MALDTSLPDMQRQQAVVDCPRSMVGRVIGKGGETIKALQQYTGAMIQIDQSVEPTKVTVAGSAPSLQLAVSMIRDIVAGNFKGFALLRQLTSGSGFQTAQGFDQLSQAHPVYVEGYGFVPPSQVGRCRVPLTRSVVALLYCCDQLFGVVVCLYVLYKLLFLNKSTVISIAQLILHGSFGIGAVSF